MHTHMGKDQTGDAWSRVIQHAIRARRLDSLEGTAFSVQCWRWIWVMGQDLGDRDPDWIEAQAGLEQISAEALAAGVVRKQDLPSPSRVRISRDVHEWMTLLASSGKSLEVAAA